MIIIYTISAPGHGVFYIGKTKNFAHRKCMHRHPKYATKLSNFIKHLFSNNIEIEFDILDFVPISLEYDFERFWINQFKKAGIDIKNSVFDKQYNGFVSKKWDMVHPAIDYFTRTT